MRVQRINNNSCYSNYNHKQSFKAVKVHDIDRLEDIRDILAIKAAVEGGVKQLGEDVNIDLLPLFKDRCLESLKIIISNILPENPTIEEYKQYCYTQKGGNVPSWLTPNNILHKVIELKQAKTGVNIAIGDIPNGNKIPDFPEEWTNASVYGTFQVVKNAQEELRQVLK